jgi:hypothetical protein
VVGEVIPVNRVPRIGLRVPSLQHDPGRREGHDPRCSGVDRVERLGNRQLVSPAFVSTATPISIEPFILPTSLTTSFGQSISLGASAATCDATFPTVPPCFRSTIRFGLAASSSR